jgi:hypothetical protein
LEACPPSAGLSPAQADVEMQLTRSLDEVLSLVKCLFRGDEGESSLTGIDLSKILGPL